MGSNTLNSYFYKPSLGASGAVELALFDAKLDIADAAIKANLDALAAKQPLDSGLTSIAALTTAANKMIYTTALDTYAVASLTAFARTILDDADASTVRTTIGAVASGANSDITSLTGLTTPLGAAYGGTGVANNVLNTITFTGNFTLGLTLTANTAVTLPTSGTLVNTAVTTLSSLVSIGTITTGVWTGTTIAIANGGTGVTTGAMTGLTSILNTALYIGRDADNQIKFASDNTIVFRLAGVDGISMISTGEFDMGAHSVGFTQQTVTYNSGTTTVDWKLGNKAIMTFGAGNITTFAFTNPTNPCNVLLILVQDGTGSRVVSAWDADIKWVGGTEPTLSTAANAIDIVSCYWDGTNYFGIASLAFA